MKILFAASEAVPFIKSGGLADVAGSLSKALRARKQTCRVVLPLYEDIPQEMREKMKFLTSFQVPLGWRSQYCGVFECTVGGVKHYLIDNEYYFRRKGLYGFFDDGERFAFFSKAVLEMLLHIDFAPEIIHCHDWQTALVPVYLNVYYRHIDKMRDIRTVFTIHNIQYQGTFDLDVATDVAGLPEPAVSIVEYKKDTNFMKGAIEQADHITTVSPTYAHEILDPWFSHGLDELLRDKQYKLTGILNGIDNKLYDPGSDDKIPNHYTADKPAGKAKNKKHLQNLMGLDADPDAMVIGMVTRMVSHKGLDLVQKIFDAIVDGPVQLVMLGSGDWGFENFFRHAANRYPGKVAVCLGFDEGLARCIYSGADVFLMPSASEPCGLAQMIALRYGTVPVVHTIGGLRDSIVDLGDEGGNGYTFQSYNAGDMHAALLRAQADFADRKTWKGIVQNAMKCDFGWGGSARRYIELYESLVAVPAAV